MRKTVLLQVRVPEAIVKELDKLVAAGYFKSRSEAVAEGIRRLLLAYSGVSSGIEAAIRLYAEGALERDLGPEEPFHVDVEEARKRVLEFFGTDDIDEIVRKLRARA